MSNHLADVMVHVDESLSEATLRTLEDELAERIGVESVWHNPRHPHLLMVDYDPGLTNAAFFVSRLERRGLHAQLVGF